MAIGWRNPELGRAGKRVQKRGEERRESANVLTQRRRDSGDRETPPGSPAPRQEDGKGLVVGTEGEPLRGRAPVT